MSENGITHYCLGNGALNEEKLIDGVLHWRGTPDGEWQPMSREKLSSLVVELRRLVALNSPWKQPYEPPFIVTCKDSA